MALAVLALFLIHSGCLTAVRAWRWIGQAVSLADEDYSALRRRALGSAYVLAIERIRRAVPRDREYLLVAGGTEFQGGAFWLRYELAPRRARYVGRLPELSDSRTVRWRMPPGPRYVVIAFSEPRPPVLMDREEFLRSLDRPHDGS
jgi:hypothetical protein